jgi:hypothetical protein
MSFEFLFTKGQSSSILTGFSDIQNCFLTMIAVQCLVYYVVKQISVPLTCSLETTAGQITIPKLFSFDMCVTALVACFGLNN